MAEVCQFSCVYRTPISGFCGKTGGYATCEHRKMDEPPTIKSAEPIKPMTNADKYFRNATDEELAERLENIDTAFEPNTIVSQRGWLDWLKQEVSDDQR